MESEINYLQELIDEAKHIVFFGGAGVSTESGIPDFRSENGLYKLKSKYDKPYEEMLSHHYFVDHTEFPRNQRALTNMGRQTHTERLATMQNCRRSLQALTITITHGMTDRRRQKRQGAKKQKRPGVRPNRL